MEEPEDASGRAKTTVNAVYLTVLFSLPLFPLALQSRVSIGG